MLDFNNDEILYIETEEIEYIQFKKLLQYGVKHAYTLKKQGINFAFDSSSHDESYRKLCDALGIDNSSVVEPFQTHTDIVKIIDKIETTEKLRDIDGLITNKTGIALTTKNADCILFVFYDPVKNVIANVHSGWRGTFQKISEKTVQKMINYYGSKAEDILCFISPSIGKDNFEVEEDVKVLCERIFGFTGKTKDFIQIGKIISGTQKYHIDTVLINKILLTGIGIKEDNIIDSGICSVYNSDKIESVRVDGDNSGRATFIVTL